jgi:uncharacterized membrane protein (UPF0136 family)
VQLPDAISVTAQVCSTRFASRWTFACNCGETPNAIAQRKAATIYVAAKAWARWSFERIDALTLMRAELLSVVRTAQAVSAIDGNPPAFPSHYIALPSHVPVLRSAGCQPAPIGSLPIGESNTSKCIVAKMCSAGRRTVQAGSLRCPKQRRPVLSWTASRCWIRGATIARMLGPAKIYFILFGALTVAGGVIGYVKAGSVPSIIAGVITGVLLIAAGFLLPEHRVAGLAIAFITSLLLAGQFIPKFLRTGKAMPAGIMSILSAIGIVVALIAWIKK